MSTFEEQVGEIVAMQKAPPGKFRVLGVDTFANPPLGEPYVIGDCDDKKTAIKLASAQGGLMNPVYVYDSEGRFVFGAGRP